MPTISRTYDSKIIGLFDRQDDADRFMARFQEVTLGNLRAFTPMRSGRLRAGNKSGGRLRSGSLRIRAIVQNTARHSVFVHEGTLEAGAARRITAKRAGAMRLPSGGGHPSIIVPARRLAGGRKWWVEGQKPQPFLERAGDAAVITMRTYHRR